MSLIVFGGNREIVRTILGPSRKITSVVLSERHILSEGICCSRLHTCPYGEPGQDVR